MLLAKTSPAHRNKKETLSQNYRRLGLAVKLGKATGGVEKHASNVGPASASTTTASAAQDPLAVTPASGYRGAFTSVKVERDADGNIVRVLRKDNPLNDPLNDLDSEDDDEENQEGSQNEDEGEPSAAVTRGKPRVVDLLEEQASAPTEKYVRHQSSREREWVERLIAKHGDNTAAMAKDFKLNPMQQTEADIKKRLRAYKEKTGA